MPRSPTWWCSARTPKTSTPASSGPRARRKCSKLIYFLQNELKVSGIRFPASSGIGIKPVSKEGSQRLVRKAIQYAIENDRVSVTLVHKGNIMKFTEGAFMQWGYLLAKEEFGAQPIGAGPWLQLQESRSTARTSSSRT